MTQYKIVAKETLEKLEAEVNSLMYEGWKPFGGICVNNWYYQSMVR